jgi:threonine dehydrogenase-like Zn-dependent dehydrogenase
MTGHGGHAAFMLAPAFTCVPLPDELSFEEGASVSCGTGTAYGALKRIDVSGRDTLAVFGQGPVGLSATMLGRAMGARVIAVDVVAERLALARELGAEETINARDTDAVKAIHDLTHGEGAETTMDCSGSAEGRLGALQSAGTWGRVAFVGEGGQVTIDVSKHMLRRQLTVHASWTFSNTGQEECARFVANRNRTGVQTNDAAQQHHKSQHRPEQVRGRVFNRQRLTPCRPNFRPFFVDYKLRLIGVTKPVILAVAHAENAQRRLAAFAFVIRDV